MIGHEQLDASGVPVYYSAEYEEAARAMAEAVEATAGVVASRWGLAVPPGCRIYVLTNWEIFLEDTVPPHLRLLVWLSKPLWKGRVTRTFELAGGWMLPWKGRPAVGVKPPHLLPGDRSSLGDRLFEPEPDLLAKVQQLTSHEFTHACTAHLRLPAWLNEGLAMLAVDHMVGRSTVLEETRALAASDPTTVDGRAYRRVRRGDHDALLRLYATGYWATRRLDEGDPEALARLLERRRSRREVRRTTRSALRLLPAGGGAS